MAARRVDQMGERSGSTARSVICLRARGISRSGGNARDPGDLRVGCARAAFSHCREDSIDASDLCRAIRALDRARKAEATTLINAKRLTFQDAQPRWRSHRITNEEVLRASYDAGCAVAASRPAEEKVERMRREAGLSDPRRPWTDAATRCRRHGKRDKQVGHRRGNRLKSLAVDH